MAEESRSKCFLVGILAGLAVFGWFFGCWLGSDQENNPPMPQKGISIEVYPRPVVREKGVRWLVKMDAIN
jgi:hypothetical protein